MTRAKGKKQIRLHNLPNYITDNSSLRKWSDKHGAYRVPAMSWFIKKGDPVRESNPTEISYHSEFLVRKGTPTTVDMEICCDEHTATAPIHRNYNVRKLVTLEADLSHLPQVDLNKTIVTREDGERYYSIDCAIEATFYGASTKYVLLCRGKRYDTVTAEYA